MKSIPTILIPVGKIFLSPISPRAGDMPAPEFPSCVHPHHPGSIAAALSLYIILFWIVFGADLALPHLSACPNACKGTNLQLQQAAIFHSTVGHLMSSYPLPQNQGELIKAAVVWTADTCLATPALPTPPVPLFLGKT